MLVGNARADAEAGDLTMAGGTKRDTINSMRLGAEEIKRLRQQNEILAAQMHVVEIFAAALGFRQGSVGVGEDIAWRLNKHADAIEEDMKRENVTSDKQS